MNLPPELSFLSSYLIEPKDAFRTAKWLLSDFHDPTWNYNFDFKENKSLNWSLKLPDGSLLTAIKNKPLLDGFKYFLILSTRNQADYTSETNALRGQQRKRFATACQLIDLMLFNCERYQLDKYGLGGLTLGNLKEMLDTLSTEALITESIYNWSTRLTNFCLELLNRTDEKIIDQILESIPAISMENSQLNSGDDGGLNIPAILVPRVRAALYANKLYRHNQNYGWAPNSVAISKAIYAECLWGITLSKPAFELLCYRDEFSPFDREYDYIPVNTGGGGGLPLIRYIDFRTTLYNLGLLHEIGLPAPSIEDLVAAEKHDVELVPAGRFRTLPSQMVFNCLRKAIEFHLNNGSEIVNGFCKLALYCKKNNTLPTDLNKNELLSIFGQKLSDLGVHEFGLSIHTIGGKRRRSKGEKKEYYKKLRSNTGLIELLRTYIGSVQFVVGVMMARRADEMCNLMTETCLEANEEWLLFLNAKSTKGLFGLRRRVARPIEPIAVQMIKNLIRMQRILVRIGYLSNPMTLFASPHLRGYTEFVDSDTATFNRNFNFFCDYFETQKNDIDQRYYIRQHQLRRFFAMLFFYCGSFRSLDTLQWMLGHTDPLHVWHYITESTDGIVLQGAKAHYVAEVLHQGGAEHFRELSKLLESRYGTSDFSLIDTNDLEDFIQELMCEGTVEIEPEFFTDETGRHFQIIAKVISAKP